MAKVVSEAPDVIQFDRNDRRADKLPMSVRQKYQEAPSGEKMERKRDKKAQDKAGQKIEKAVNEAREIEQRKDNKWEKVYTGAASGITNLL